MDLELQKVERVGRAFARDPGARDLLVITLSALLAVCFGDPTLNGISAAYIIAFIGALVRIWWAGTIAQSNHRGDLPERAGPFRFTDDPCCLGRLLLLAGLAVGAGNIAVALIAISDGIVTIFASNHARRRHRHAGLALLPVFIPLPKHVSSRFSMSWALWRGPNAQASYLFPLGVALSAMSVYVFLPQPSWVHGLSLVAGSIAIILAFTRRIAIFSAQRRP